jgi:cytochrome c oxidase assembly factor CtaG
VDDEVAPVLLVLAAPDQLRVQVGIARVAHLLRLLLFASSTDWYSAVGMFLRFGVVVLERFDGLGA